MILTQYIQLKESKFLFNIAVKLYFSNDLKDVKGDMSHAKKSWVKQKTGATSSDPNW